MKKIFIVILFFFGTATSIFAAHVTDRYGGWYNVIVDTSPYEFHYRLYKELGQTGVNDFEYKSIENDIFAIVDATETSECSRLKIIGNLLEARVDPYFSYPAGVHRSTIPFDFNSLKYCEEGKSFYQIPTIEAENGQLSGDWSVRVSTWASGGKYVQSDTIYTPDISTGIASYNIEITTGGTYSLWTRTVGVSAGSFYVSVDTAVSHEFIVLSSNNWNLDPVLAQMNIGFHQINFWNKLGNLKLDKILITKDKDDIP